MYFFAISWQSIIAGTITTLAISIVMAVLGVALGFSVVKPRADNPVAGLGVTFGFWGVLSVLVSLAAGGFAAGMFSVGKGVEHGFMVWATVLIVGAFFSSAAVGMAVKTVGSMVKGIGSGAASVASAVGSTVGEGVSELAQSAVDGVQKHIGLDFDADQINDKIAGVLKDTGVASLQPDFLKEKIREAKGDLRASLHELRTGSDNFEQVAADFLAKQKQRFDSIVKNVDADAAVNALAEKRGISRDEAKDMVDNAVFIYSRAVDKAKDAIGDVQEQIQEAKVQLGEAAEQARIKADHMASTAARSALAAAVALILGAAVSMYAGHCGNRYSENYLVAVETAAIQVPAEARNVRTGLRP